MAIHDPYNDPDQFKAEVTRIIQEASADIRPQLVYSEMIQHVQCVRRCADLLQRHADCNPIPEGWDHCIEGLVQSSTALSIILSALRTTFPGYPGEVSND